MLIAQVALGIGVAAAWIYWLLCLDSARRWAAAACTHPEAELPPATVLKPLCGADPEMADNLRSFLRQDYPRYQAVFGALDLADPALEVARQVAGEAPCIPSSIAAGGEAFGPNFKVCNLEAMLSSAEHDILVLADSDMRVEPDYLRRILAPFADPSVGLVTCLYRGFRARGLASSLEAFGIGTDFAPSVLLAHRFWGIRYAFGSTIAIRQQVLEQIGGFRPLATEIADDYLLGARTADAGWKVALSDYVVDDVLGSEPLTAMWTRRLRWARTTRAMAPAGYSGTIVTHGIPLAVLFLLAAGLSVAGWVVLAATLAIRAATATWICNRYLRDRNLPRLLPLLPLSDLLGFALWVACHLGNRVEWRGVRYRLGRHGRLIPL